MVAGPSRSTGSGRGTLPEVRKWFGDLPEGPKVVEGPSWKFGSDGGVSRRSGSGRGTFPVVRKWSVDPPGGPVVVGGSPKGPEVV